MGFTTTRLLVTLTIALILQPSVNQAQSGPDFEDAPPEPRLISNSTEAPFSSPEAPQPQNNSSSPPPPSQIPVVTTTAPPTLSEGGLLPSSPAPPARPEGSPAVSDEASSANLTLPNTTSQNDFVPILSALDNDTALAVPPPSPPPPPATSTKVNDTLDEVPSNRTVVPATDVQSVGLTTHQPAVVVSDDFKNDTQEVIAVVGTQNDTSDNTTETVTTETVTLLTSPEEFTPDTISDRSDSLERFGGSDSTPPKLQTQIYIISGVFGVLMFILILLVLALAVAVARLAKQLKERNGELKYRAVSASGGGSVIEAEHESNMSPPENRRINNGGIANSYINEGFTGNSHEMEERRREPHNEVDRMGYEAYSYSHARQQQHSVNENRTPHPEAGVAHDTVVKEEESGIELKRYSRDSREIFNRNTNANGKVISKTKEFAESNHQELQEENLFKKPSLRSGNIPRARSDYTRSDSRGGGGGGNSYRVEHQLNVEESVVPAGGQRDSSPPPEGGDIRSRDRRQSPVAYGNRGPPASSGQRRDNRRY